MNLFRPIFAFQDRLVGVLELIGNITYLVGDTLVLSRRALLSSQGRRLGWENLWAQMVRVGVRSIPIVSLVLMCIGAILAMQMAPLLKQYGALSQVADIIAFAMARELGPLVS